MQKNYRMISSSSRTKGYRGTSSSRTGRRQDLQEDYTEDSDHDDEYSSDFSDYSEEEDSDEEEYRGYDDESDEDYFDESEDEGYSSRYNRRQIIQRDTPQRAYQGQQRGSGVTGMLRSTLLKPTDPQKQGLKKTMASYGEMASSTLSSIVHTGYRMKRDLKEYFAGDVEAAMLKVTRPDDYCPDPLTVNSIIGQTRFFVQDEDVTSNSNCYRAMLRKIWQKLAEDDWRTVTKALYLLHKLLRDVGAEDARCFKILLEKMSREVHERRTMERCFSIKVISKVKSEDTHYQSFIQRYATYVLKRARTFTSGFIELKLVGANMRPEDVIATLMKAKKALTVGLNCMVTAEEESEVSVVCMELLVHDLYNLWTLFHKKLKWVVDQQEEGDLFQAWDENEVAGLMDQFKEFYLSRYEDIKHFILENDDLLSLYGFCLPTMDLPAKHQFKVGTSEDEDAAEVEASEDNSETQQDPI